MNEISGVNAGYKSFINHKMVAWKLGVNFVLDLWTSTLHLECLESENVCERKISATSKVRPGGARVERTRVARSSQDCKRKGLLNKCATYVWLHVMSSFHICM